MSSLLKLEKLNNIVNMTNFEIFHHDYKLRKVFIFLLFNKKIKLEMTKLQINMY